MMNKRVFTDIAKNILRFNKGLRSPQIMHPVREWLIGLFIAILIFGSSAGWSAYMYIKYQNASVTGGSNTEEVVVYRESLVSAALQEFSERQNLHKELLAGESSDKSTSGVTNEVFSNNNSVEQEMKTTSADPASEEPTPSAVTEEEIIKNDSPAEAVSPEEYTIDIAPTLN